MGAVLCAVSNIMYMGEKCATWMAVAAVITCLAITLIMMLGMGVGLGYNYCFVDIKTKHKYVPGHYEYEVVTRYKKYRRSGLDNETDEVELDDETLAHKNETEQFQNETESYQNETDIANMTSTSADTDTNSEAIGTENSVTAVSIKDTDKKEVVEVSSTSKTVIQIDGLDLMTLLTKLKSEKRNYSLQIVTT